MLFEMVFGKHPIWDKDNDNRKIYKEKLKDLSMFTIEQEKQTK